MDMKGFVLTVDEAGFAERVSEVSLGDAFVYGFQKAASGRSSNTGSFFLFLSSFLSIFFRAGYEW
jgi:hypothetical protein